MEYYRRRYVKEEQFQMKSLEVHYAEITESKTKTHISYENPA